MTESLSPSPVRLPTPLVEAEWLAEHLDSPHLRVLDATIEVRAFEGAPLQAA